LKYIYKLLAFGVIISFLFPLIKVGSTTSVKPDWFFTLFINIIIFFNARKLLFQKLHITFYILFGFIVVSTIISNYLSGYYYLPAGGNFRPPVTFLLILNKISIFTFFSYLISKGYISIKETTKIVTLIFLFGLAFGVFQFFDLFGAKQFALSHFLDEGGVQEHVFLASNRIVGTSPAVISWGGCALLLVHYFLFVEKRVLLKGVGAALAIFNVIGTASRASLFAFAVSLVLIYIIKAVVIKKNLFSVFKVIGYCILFFTISFSLAKTFIPQQVEFLEKRIDNTEEHMTDSGRGEQLNYFKAVLEQDPVGYLFGVGDSVIVNYGYLELDFAYVFVGFGILGFVLHYLLLYFLLKEAYELRQFDSNYFLFCWGSTLGYLVFSVGFYFFYELYMGLPFWWLNGLVLGELYRLKFISVNS